MTQNDMSPIYKGKLKKKKLYAGPSPIYIKYAVFGYHSYQYANELKFTNLHLFSISNNC